MSKSLYEILGVSPDATDDEINKAYKKMAIKYHPDKNVGNEEESAKMFAEINRAKDVLLDPKKRSMYDQFGDNPPEEMGEFVQVVRYKFKFTLEEIYNGTKRKEHIIVNKKCHTCHGHGTFDSKKHDCEKCNGTGATISFMHSGFMQSTCPACKGTGVGGKTCSSCNGRRIVNKQVEIDIDLPKGSNKAFKCDGNVYGIEELPHPVFKRDGNNNLSMVLKISLAESIIGFGKKIRFLNGKDYVITYKMCRHGDLIVVKGKGMTPDADLLVKIFVVMPKTMPDIKKVESALGPVHFDSGEVVVAKEYEEQFSETFTRSECHAQ